MSPLFRLRPRHLSLGLVLALTLLAGCKRLRPSSDQYVYVVVRDTWLRDRVAPVSNRVAMVTNTQKLKVLAHDRRFLQVETEKKEKGWIQEPAVITQEIWDQFKAVNDQHAKDPALATGVLRDDLYIHLKPGRDSERFYLLPEGDKLKLLQRASVPKQVQPGWGALPKPIARPGKAKGAQPATNAAPAAPPMEDWWLVRDQVGRTGWMLSRRIDIDVPLDIAGYSEGQKIAGAYVLRTLTDPEADTPDHIVREYATVLNSYKDGLPYDFDQLRVFVWNMKRHRYETSYRQRNLVGFLPVTVTGQGTTQAAMPQFTLKLAENGIASIDPVTGLAHADHLTQITFRLEGTLVHSYDPNAAAAPPVAAPKPAAPAAPAPAASHASSTHKSHTGHAHSHTSTAVKKKKKKVR